MEKKELIDVAWKVFIPLMLVNIAFNLWRIANYLEILSKK